MVTDLGEVFRLGTEKAGENLAFRRFLANHHYPSGPFQIIAQEVQSHVDCTACANCCRHGEVAVSGEDIAAMARHLGTTVEEVERLYLVGVAGAPAQHELRTTEAGCLFLDGTLCLIYEARPKACREFPHVATGSHTLGSRPASHDRWAAMCPIVYNAIEAYKRVTGFHARAAAQTGDG
ncbi:MAG: YkgJ family cysteine cluster protein [Acidobacteria bacterium]|nr:YkgJ family cysteine cluster protein [Acidobacteriota bacterium]